MSLHSDLFATLKSLVGNRMSALHFPQPPVKPTWPAIRYLVVDRIPVADICGDGDDATAETRVQLDLAADTENGSLLLRDQVMATMKTFSPPARLDSSREYFDPDRKTYVQVLDYQIHGSS